MSEPATTVSGVTVTAPKWQGDPDEVTIAANGSWVSGWQRVAITRSIETCPNTFELGYTEQDGLGETTIVSPGDPCVIRIGSDTIITGYADKVLPAIGPEGHTIQIAGRGKCQDLVDCTAEWPTASIANTSILDAASKLAAPYGISVSLAEGVQLGDPLPEFNITLTDTPFALIEEMARNFQVLPYEDANGNLVLGAVGTVAHASGFAEGQNVLRARAIGDMSQRFSEYYGYTTSTQMYADLGSGSNLLGTQTDPSVARHRRRAIIAEATIGYQQLLLKRLAWERTRRAGRALMIEVTVDSWRDGAGKLWTPNQLVPVDLPSLHVSNVKWVIGQVTYLRDAEDEEEGGTRAIVLVMPASAYTPEPIQLQPIFPDLTPPGSAK